MHALGDHAGFSIVDLVPEPQTWVNHGITMVGLRRVSKEEGSSVRAFVRANQTALWKIAYFVIAAFLFAAAETILFRQSQLKVSASNKD